MTGIKHQVTYFPFPLLVDTKLMPAVELPVGPALKADDWDREYFVIFTQSFVGLSK